MGSDLGHSHIGVSRREVVPLAQEEEPPIVKMHGEEQTEEQEQERAKHLPAEATASSSGPSASGYNVDVPMTDVFEASLRDLHARRSCDSKGGRLCCEHSADWENSFFFSGGSVKLGHYCFSSSCCAGYAGSAYQSITTCMIVAGMCGRIGNLSFVCGALPLPLHKP